MKFAAILAIMLAGMLMYGCASAPAQPQEQAPAVIPPGGQEFAPQEEIPSEIPAMEPEEKAAEPAMNDTPAPVETGCAALTGSDRVDCVFAEARDAGDVAMCASDLLDKDGRFGCITQWCASEARDFNQCEKLAGDDRQGCILKCSPNAIS